MDLLQQLRTRARQLQRAAAQGDEEALARLKRHPELHGLRPENAAGAVKRRHCLAILAKECGFSGWGQLLRVIGGATDGDFGTLLHKPACFAHWNVWLASYEEARNVRQEHGGYLLPYKRQFLLVDRHYLATLGLDADDPLFAELGRDWVFPKSHAARESLYATLIAQQLASLAAS